MFEVVFLVALAWVVLALLGAAVLSAAGPAARHALLPAAPLVGVAFLVVVLHATGLVVGVRGGLPVAVALALVLVVVGLRRGSARPFLDRRSLAWTAAGLMVAIPFTVVAAAPSLRLHSSGVVSPSPSNDAVWYVSVSQWLERHSILDVPVIPGAPDGISDGVPGDGPAVSALTFPLRVGQELVQAALNVLTGTSPLDTFSPWLAAWVLLVPGGCIAAGALLGIGRRTGLVAGGVIAASAVLVQQVYAQNAASVLGIALALPVVACVVAAVGPDPRVPLLLAALMLSGFVATYTEYAPFAGPALVGAVLLRRGGLVPAVRRAAAVVALAVLISPLGWWRAVGTMTSVRGGAADAWRSPFTARPLVTINRLVGAGPASGGLQPSVIGLALGLLVLAGMVLALWLGPVRGMWLGLLAVGLPFLGYLSLQKLGYTQRRAVEIAVPLALFMSVTGWSTLLARVRERTAETGPRWRGVRVVPSLAAAALLAVALLWSGVNVRSSLAVDDGVDVAHRHVDASYAQAVGWVQRYGGHEGKDVSVLVPDYFEQHWLVISLADEEEVEYPAIRQDYFRTTSFWSGGTDRYWLVGDGVQVDADEGVVVAANDHFRLLDLSRGEAVLAAPFDLGTWFPAVLADDATATLGDARLLVVTTPGAGTKVALTVRAGVSAPVDVSVGAPGQPPSVVDDLVARTVEMPLTLPEAGAPVVLDVHAVVASGVDASNSIEMAGIRRDP